VETLEQQLANDLSDAYRKRAIEQVAFAGYLMALKSNNIEVTESKLQPYADALNSANKSLWNVLWKAYEAFIILHRPGKTPVIKYNQNKKCDNRCMNARGYDCECICNSANHGINHLSLLNLTPA
jgi:hypothetical protein